MAYLEQFARNRRSKEKTKVLTARLPESLYDEFQDFCDSLGLSISEAIYLLVEKEVKSIQPETSSLPKTPKKNDVETKTNTGEHKINTLSPETNIITNQANQNKTKTNRADSKTNTGRFTVKPFVVENEAPCPICEKWFNASNLSRHAKTQHETNTEALYTEYKDKVNKMVKQKKTGELEKMLEGVTPENRHEEFKI